MLDVQNEKVYLTRGDTAYLEIELITKSGENYTPAYGDKLYFRLKKSANKGSLLLEKEVNINTLTLELSPEDTADLDFGTYCYEVELVTALGQHFTVIENAAFILGAELG